MELGISQDRYAMAVIDLFEGKTALEEAIAFFTYMRDYPGMNDEVIEHIDSCLCWARNELNAKIHLN